MANVFEFYSIVPLMEVLKEDHKQINVAKSIGLSYQAVNQVFKDKHHWIYPQVSRWRKAFKFKRDEGDYFELLALIHAYPFQPEEKRPRMLDRAFHIVGRLEKDELVENKVATSLLYWLDPMASILRNLVELHGFPVDDDDVCRWVEEKINYVGVLGNLKKDIGARIAGTWFWLKSIRAVVLSPNPGRWVKAEPNIMSPAKAGPEIHGLHEAIFVLLQVNIHQDFIHDAGTKFVLGAKAATFSISSRILPLLEQLSRDFLHSDILRKLNYACNKDDLARLAAADPEYHREVTAFRRSLEEKGYAVPEVNDTDIDTTVQVLLATRRVTK